MVKVYSITQCPWCDKVKKYLKSRGVAYEEHNIELSDADRDECYKISGDHHRQRQRLRRQLRQSQARRPARSLIPQSHIFSLITKSQRFLAGFFHLHRI